MALFGPASFADLVPVARGDGVLLRAPDMADHAAWARLRGDSRAFLAPWEPLWPADDLTRAAFRARMTRYARDVRADLAYPWFLFRAGDGALMGGITLGLVRRGVAQTATLGYWIGQPFARQGHMTAALRALMPVAFGPLGLRRVEAACLPANTASIRLLERIGFQREGYARSYLCIAGEWRDHWLYAMLSSDPVG